MAIDATLGGANSNSYVTLDEADAYFENHAYSSIWNGQEEVLIYACVLLDNLVAWNGYKYYWDQAIQRLQFPRSMSLINQMEGSLLPQPYIPNEIKAAQCELTLYLLSNTSLLPENGFDKVEVGPIKIDFNQMAAGNQDLLPPIVQGMISRFGKVLRSGTGIMQAPLTR
jgi:hypothetical protein